MRRPPRFDEDKQEYQNLSLFPEDRELPAEAVDSIQVRLSGLELRHPRPFGNCWLASELWHQLGLNEFWGQRLSESRGEVSWEKVLRLLVVNRLLEPGSEFRVHRHWFVESAMDALLGEDFAVAGKVSGVNYSSLPTTTIIPYRRQLPARQSGFFRLDWC